MNELFYFILGTMIGANIFMVIDAYVSSLARKKFLNEALNNMDFLMENIKHIKEDKENENGQ